LRQTMARKWLFLIEAATPQINISKNEAIRLLQVHHI
jgi:hypothetical protein